MNISKKKIKMTIILVIINAIIIVCSIFFMKNIKRKTQEGNTNNTELESVKEQIKKDTSESISNDIKDLYTEEYNEYLNLSDEEKLKKNVVPRKYDVKYEDLDRIIEKEQKSNNGNKYKEENEKSNDNKYEETIEKDDDKKQNNEEIPSKYDLRDHINLKVENQMSEGLCWDFASLTCVESNLALTQGKEYDFSEAHVNYLTSNLLSDNNRIPGAGGNFKMFLEYYVNKFDGFVDENKLFYSGDYSKCGEALIDMEKINESVYDVVAFPSYSSNWTEEQFEKYQKAIKYHIMNYGSLYSSVNSFSDTNVYFKDYNDRIITAGHAISIIGWDDNYSKYNFKSNTGKVPEKDGAYIFLNSWGKEYGEDGYGYISYCDYMVHLDLNGVISTNKKDLVNVQNLSEVAQKYIYNNLMDNLIDNKYIKKSVIESVISIDLSNQNLTQIDGLEIFVNLKKLDISNNKIKDISNLKDLNNLYYIDFSDNKDITGWKNLQNVEVIIASNCDIKDISGIENCNVTWLDLSENKEIKNLELINKIKNLYYLKLEDCDLNDLSIIKNNMIRCLDISKNKSISNYSILADNYDYFEELIIKDCNIKDIYQCGISNIHTDSLNLSDNIDINNIDKLSSVTTLNLSNCGLNNIECIKEFSMINFLDISKNNITDISPLNNVGSLASLVVSENVGIKGNLNNSNITFLNINNCNLDNNFDYFGINTLCHISCKGNNIDFNTVVSKNRNLFKVELDECSYDDYINKKSFSDICIENTNIYLNVKLPEGSGRMYTNNVISNLEKKDFIKEINNNFIEFELYKDEKLTINNYTNKKENIYNCIFTYCFSVDNTVSPIDIQIKCLPKKYKFSIDENFDFTGLKVSAIYENKIFKEVYDYRINDNYDNISYGLCNINVNKGDLNAWFPIFCEKKVVLKFKSEKVYKYILLKLQNHNTEGYYLNNNDDTLTINVSGAIYNKLFLEDFSIDMDTLMNMDPIKELDVISISIINYSCDTDEIDREKIVYVFPNVKFAYANKDNEDIILIDNGKFVYKNKLVDEDISLVYEQLENYANFETSMVKNIDIIKYTGNIEDIDVNRICQIFKNVKHIYIHDNHKNEDLDLMESRDSYEEIINDESISLNYDKLDEFKNKNTNNVINIEIVDYKGNIKDIDVNRIKVLFKNVQSITIYDKDKNEDIDLLNQVEEYTKEIIKEDSIQLDYNKIDEYSGKNTDNVIYIEIINNKNSNTIDIVKIQRIFKNVKMITTFDNQKNEDIILLNKE